MRIVGIDPGLHITGYACVELQPRSLEPALIEGGVIRLKRSLDMSQRLAQLHEDLTDVLRELKPERVVVEKLFSHYKHVRTSILMGHARGVVLLAASQLSLQFDELAPTEVKRAVAGNGHATKQQMQVAVMNQCCLPKLPSPPDVADAIAIALCAARRLHSARSCEIVV
jgi:crossover junction endodeoxyribonuclease RuvC